MAHHHYECTLEDIIRSVEKIKGTVEELEPGESDLRDKVDGFIKYLQSDVGSSKIVEYVEFLKKVIKDSNLKHQEDVESLNMKIQDLNGRHQEHAASLLMMTEDQNVVDQNGVDKSEKELMNKGNEELQKYVEAVQQMIDELYLDHQRKVEPLQKKVQASYVGHHKYVEFLYWMIQGIDVNQQNEVLEYHSKEEVDGEHEEHIEPLLTEIQESNVKHQKRSEIAKELIVLCNLEQKQYSRLLLDLTRMSVEAGTTDQGMSMINEPNQEQSALRVNHNQESLLMSQNKEHEGGKFLGMDSNDSASEIQLSGMTNGSMTMDTEVGSSSVGTSTVNSNQESVLKMLTAENEEKDMSAESGDTEGTSSASMASDQGITMTNPNQESVLISPNEENEDGKSPGQVNNESASGIQNSGTGMTRATGVGPYNCGMPTMNRAVGGMPIPGRGSGPLAVYLDNPKQKKKKKKKNGPKPGTTNK